jgi:hypothetical protein
MPETLFSAAPKIDPGNYPAEVQLALPSWSPTWSGAFIRDPKPVAASQPFAQTLSTF